MAAVAGLETVKITINEIELEVPKGELIVESVKRLGLEIPIFCYHRRLKPVGMCRMCLVEVGFKQPDGSVRKMPKPQAGCTLPASDGMVVYTDSEMVHTDRKGVLEFLLINHPLDCPICDRGGECPLQNNTLAYGPSTSRFVEMKRHLPKALPLSQYVTLDLERCIQCGRCVRFTEEISGDSQLAFRFRGAAMQPSTFQLTDFESKFSGNTIEICPVGALTSAKYRFRARPWDLETKPAVCTECSNGCNVWFDHRAGRFVRINGRTNEAVNEEWTCDKGKFGHDWYNSPERLTEVLVRDGDALRASSWGAAYTSIVASLGRGSVAGLVGPKLSNEALFLFNRLLRETFAGSDVDFRWTRDTADLVGKVSSSLSSLDSAGSVLVFGPIADELPIVFLRVRKAWFNGGAKVVVASSGDTDADTFAEAVLRYRPGTVAELAKGLVSGEGDLSAVASATGVSADELRKAVAALRDPVVVTSHALLDEEGGKSAIGALKPLLGFNCYATGANDQGAIEMGFSSGRTTAEILKAAADGQVKSLWVVGCDPLRDFHDRALAQRALESVEFLVVQDTMMTETAHYASVVLPMAAPAEHDGTYTNCERRVQRVQQVIPAPGDAKPAWRIFSECMIRATDASPYFSPKDVMQEIARKHPQFARAQYDALEGEGVLLHD
ncbi:MAG: NADH-quinone oxidoreductase subunit NuoG [Fimbriimonadaceae bacterium]